MEKPFEDVIKDADFGPYNACLISLYNSVYGELFFQALHSLKIHRLYQSHIHGVGHIKRVLLFAALIAKDNELTPEDTKLFFDACSYHDVGRIDDSKDDDHGRRSAEQIQDITLRNGIDLSIIKAAVTAHSPSDEHMTDILASYGLSHSLRAKKIADFLKDADALDRVRVHDLDVKYLRNPHSKKYADLAERLYQICP